MRCPTGFSQSLTTNSSIESAQILRGLLAGDLRCRRRSSGGGGQSLPLGLFFLAPNDLIVVLGPDRDVLRGNLLDPALGAGAESLLDAVDRAEDRVPRPDERPGRTFCLLNPSYPADE